MQSGVDLINSKRRRGDIESSNSSRTVCAKDGTKCPLLLDTELGYGCSVYTCSHQHGIRVVGFFRGDEGLPVRIKMIRA